MKFVVLIVVVGRVVDQAMTSCRTILLLRCLTAEAREGSYDISRGIYTGQ
jgi:hypothetical protein